MYFDSKSNQIDYKWLEKQDVMAVKSATKLRGMQPLARTVGELDADLLDLVTKCLDFDRTTRIRAHDIMYHPFVLKAWPDAKRQNAEREKYEFGTYGHVLGQPGQSTRVE